MPLAEIRLIGLQDRKTIGPKLRIGNNQLKVSAMQPRRCSKAFFLQIIVVGL
jgi:hypothetical protein